MKKDVFIIIITAVLICIVGVVAYLVMDNMEYFNNTGSSSFTGLEASGMLLIPVLKWLWDKFLQILSILIAIAIGAIILAGLGLIFA